MLKEQDEILERVMSVSLPRVVVKKPAMALIYFKHTLFKLSKIILSIDKLLRIYIIEFNNSVN